MAKRKGKFGEFGPQRKRKRDISKVLSSRITTIKGKRWSSQYLRSERRREELEEGWPSGYLLWLRSTSSGKSYLKFFVS